MDLKNWLITTVSLMIALPVIGGTPVGEPLGISVGTELGAVVGTAFGGALPLGIGGVAAVAALSLVIGVQLVKRNKK
ncbi:MAG: hypothetical protein DRR06_10985 [Gammaproteobacteria bacterium]|nr:MAG: hypothetical protein DRR06_10985 [Gammaproteobacteria bacterium]RLA48931.1 MAG: hypothetical protein DRR42_16195 [Gammaproteobacteria bacterium]